MNCQEAETIIQTSLDRPLTPAERTRLDAHLDGCAACQRAWDEYRALGRLASAWTREETPGVSDADAFLAAVMGQIEIRPAPTSVPFAPRGVFALLALALLIGLAWLPQTFTSPSLTGAWPNLHTAPTDAAAWLRTLPDALSAGWRAARTGLTAPPPLLWLLPALLLVNVLCYRTAKGRAA